MRHFIQANCRFKISFTIRFYGKFDSESLALHRAKKTCMKKRPRNILQEPEPEHYKIVLKKRIDVAMAAYLVGGKTIEQWGQDLFYSEILDPRSRQRD